MVSKGEKERLMDRKVVSCPVEGTWLVNDAIPMIGKSGASGIAVHFYWGRGGWWQCEKCGAFIDTTRTSCEHVRAVEGYEMKKGESG